MKNIERETRICDNCKKTECFESQDIESIYFPGWIHIDRNSSAGPLRPILEPFTSEKDFCSLRCAMEYLEELKKPKVIEVGVGRTGTTSLHKALEILGYKCIRFVTNFEQFEGYDAVTEPLAIPTEDIVEKFPDVKYILTVREIEDWLIAAEVFYTYIVPVGYGFENIRKRLYGSVYFEKELYRENVLKYNQMVRDLFKDRPENLLEINICAGEGWEKLCPFLGKEIPSESFPSVNGAKELCKKDGITELPKHLEKYVEDTTESDEITDEIDEITEETKNE